MKRILVTGGCGFIGSNFINKYWLENPDAIIYNLDALYYCSDITNVEEKVRESDRYIFIHGNLQDIEIIKTALNDFAVTQVVHFAAQSHVDNSFEHSIQYTMDNILGTHNLLEPDSTVNLNCLFT